MRFILIQIITLILMSALGLIPALGANNKMTGKLPEKMTEAERVVWAKKQVSKHKYSTNKKQQHSKVASKKSGQIQRRSIASEKSRSNKNIKKIEFKKDNYKKATFKKYAKKPVHMYEKNI